MQVAGLSGCYGNGCLETAMPDDSGQVERWRKEKRGVMGNGVIGGAGSLTVEACGARFEVAQQEQGEL
ncbi:hypothetical protein AOLI_G00053150 [Acnodon oligacanthus]